MYKKRFIAFATSLPNSVPTEMGNILIEETSTIVSAIVSMESLNISAAAAAMMEVRSGIVCMSAAQFDASPIVIPDPGTPDQIETMNGFMLPSMWAVGDTIAGGTGRPTAVTATVREKFKFKRKCDRNTRVVIWGDTIVRNGTATNVLVHGYLELIIMVK